MEEKEGRQTDRLTCAAETAIDGLKHVADSNRICCLLDGVPSDAVCQQHSKLRFTCCDRERQVLCDETCCDTEVGSKCDREWDDASHTWAMCCTGPQNPSCNGEPAKSPSLPIWVVFVLSCVILGVCACFASETVRMRLYELPRSVSAHWQRLSGRGLEEARALDRPHLQLSLLC